MEPWNLSDLPDRDAIRTDLGQTLIVEAAAGTGKTTELVNRIVAVLARGLARVDQIVAVTFTEKAAGELKLRLRAALEEARQRVEAPGTRNLDQEPGTRDSHQARSTRHEAPSTKHQAPGTKHQAPGTKHQAPGTKHQAPGTKHQALLESAIARLEEAHISTIHSFCADLLRERPVEARVDPQFTVLTDAQAERLYTEAFRVWLQEQLADPPEGIRRSLRRPSWSAGPDAAEDGPIERLRRAGWELQQWRDFTAPWQRVDFDREPIVDELIAQIRHFVELTADPGSTSDPLYTGTRAMRQFLDEVNRTQSAGLADYDGWEAGLITIRRDKSFKESRKGRGTFYKPGVGRHEVDDQRLKLTSALEAFERAANADLAARLHDELSASVERYERLKARSGSLDFVDLLLGARNLVRNDDAVRRSFQGRFTHIFVDEFQDTDPLQAEILLLLASTDSSERDWRRTTPARGKLFIVGDPKQSIYRFRRADVGIYQEVCELLARRGARAVKLTTSFRAVGEIQRLVNAAFEPVMTGDRATLQASYVPLQPFRGDASAQPGVVALPIPEPYGGWGRVGAMAIEKSLPDAVGAMVDWLINKSKWEVTERYTADAPSDLSAVHAFAPLVSQSFSSARGPVAQSSSSARDAPSANRERRVPIAPRHICLLFRRFTSWRKDVTRPYVDALEARGISHLLVGGKAFHDREEVETIRAALTAIEWPDDELSVFATLHGALFAIGDEELLEYRHRLGHFHPFRVPDAAPDRLAAIPKALQLLRALHEKRNRRPVADTISELIEATRAHVGFVLQRAGEQVLANVLYVAELARQYELGGGMSFRGFVEELDDAAARSQAPEAPILEEGSDGVRLMTVHKAKGLEFPIVILADITARLTPREANRYLDAQRGLCAFKLAGCAPLDLLNHQAEELTREEAEGQRIAYVAATRARDLLVVPAVGDGSGTFDGGWVGALNRAIYPPADKRRDGAAAPGCPPFGKDSVFSRPDDNLVELENVAPGLHVFEPGTRHAHEKPGTKHSHQARSTKHEAPSAKYSVVWWDPHALELHKEPRYGLRGEDLISKDIDSAVVDKGVLEFRLWDSRRKEMIDRASTPGIAVRTAVEWAVQHERSADSRDAGDADIGRTDINVPVIELPRDPGRPSGPRFGTLVHAVLSTIPLAADRREIDESSAVQGRVVGATPQEVTAAAEAVAAVLAHPLLLRARGADARNRCRRETPVTCRDDGGGLVEGIVDLAFEEESGWTVVDFKTDRELDKELERYRKQVALYARAIGATMKKPVSAVLIKV